MNLQNVILKNNPKDLETHIIYDWEIKSKRVIKFTMPQKESEMDAFFQKFI